MFIFNYNNFIGLYNINLKKSLIRFNENKNVPICYCII